MRLRQVALVAKNLVPVKKKVFTLLGLQSDYEDKGVDEFGLRNSVMAMGDTFLEVVSPMRGGTTAGRLLERRQGDGGYMVLAQVDDLCEISERTNIHKVRKIWEIERPEVKAFHVHPKDMGAAIVSFDQMTPPENWVWGGPGWRERLASYVGNITACDLQSSNPESLAKRWSEVFSKDLVNKNNKIMMALDHDSAINFVKATDGRGDGVSAVEFDPLDANAIRHAADVLHLAWCDNEVELCGIRFRFRF